MDCSLGYSAVHSAMPEPARGHEQRTRVPVAGSTAPLGWWAARGMRRLGRRLVAGAVIRILLNYARVQDRTILVIARRYGGLGNRLLMSSHIMAASLVAGAEVINGTFSSYAGLFEGTKRDLLCRFPARSGALGEWPRLLRRLVDRSLNIASQEVGKADEERGIMLLELEEPVHRDLEPELDGGALGSASIVFFRGWLFLHQRGLYEHGDAIRAYFTPVRSLEDEIKRPVQELRAASDLVVGVTIRHGDYRTFRDGRYFFPATAYVEVMRKVERLFAGRKVGFFVTSNEPQDEAVFSGLRFVFRVGQEVADLYALAKCDYILGVPSTFAGWASFYGKVPAYLMESPEAEVSLGSFRVWSA
jgi:hypothetical protein